MGMDINSLAVYGGIFESKQAAEEYIQLIDGKPQRLMDDMYLTGDFNGHIEIYFSDKSTNRAEELFCSLPYGENIVGMLKAMFKDKLKRKINTAIVIYDFYLGAEHFTGHSFKQMSEKKTENYYVFHIENICNYKAPAYLSEHPEYKVNFSKE